MSLDEAVTLAREIRHEGYAVCSINCMEAGGQIGDEWSITFKPRAASIGMMRARDRAEWEYWLSATGRQRMVTGMYSAEVEAV